jgi:drug/metabolite transporter (DMT)-like permease
MNFLYVVGCVVFTVLGQLLIKQGAMQVKDGGSLLATATNPFIIGGLLSALVAAASWIKALQYYEMSWAYPFMSVSFLLVALLSALVFGEHIKATQWAGLAVVLLGLFVGSR